MSATRTHHARAPKPAFVSVRLLAHELRASRFHEQSCAYRGRGNLLLHEGVADLNGQPQKQN